MNVKVNRKHMQQLYPKSQDHNESTNTVYKRQYQAKNPNSISRKKYKTLIGHHNNNTYQLGCKIDLLNP